MAEKYDGFVMFFLGWWSGHTSPIREEYLAAIKSADAGEIEPLIELHGRYSR